MPFAIEDSPKSKTASISSMVIDDDMEPIRKIIESKSMEQHQLDTPPPSEPSDSFDASNFFDLKPPPPPTETQESQVEEIMKRLYSEEHLHYVLGDQSLFQRFLSFLNRYRPNLVPTLTRYMEMRKAMKAVEYANAVARMIQWPSQTDYYKFSRIDAAQTDVRFEDYAIREVNILISEALPAWITYLIVNVVSDCVTRDITGHLLPVIKELIGTLGEVFCISDPSQKENPIIYCSQEFYRTTQYGTSLAINRNCRFLQGPQTDKNTTSRIAKAIANGQETNEILLNYRRDGTPFANLLMVSPLYDDKGIVRYFVGAQVDVTGLILDGLGLESFRCLLQKHSKKVTAPTSRPPSRGRTPSQSGTPTPYSQGNVKKMNESLIKLTDLSMMLSPDESEVVTKNTRPVTPPLPDNESVTSDGCSIRSMLPTNKVPRPIRRIVDSQDSEINNYSITLQRNGQAPARSFPGIYRHYLLVRPYPSLQIIFACPSLRLPGLLRTPLFTKIGGPSSVLSALEEAFRDGVSVTARVLWLPKHGYPANAKARRRWIRCTPLLGSDDSIGVWMVILVPADSEDDVGRPICDSGYHSLGGPDCLLGLNRYGTGRNSNSDQLFDDNDDLTAIESLVEGRRNSPLDSNSNSSRLRRVTILDHDGDSIHKSESSFGIGSSSENGITSLGRRGTDDRIYGQFLANTTSNSTIIEEEI
ncbi:Phototropin-2 [Erysiphe necator]|nr:Phototropin-2 [Erysiphe necator]